MDLPASAWQDLPLRRVPAQDRSRDKVARALAAADAIVREQGVTGITLTQVAARAEVSVGALHQYLPDREAIVAALVWRYHARLEALLTDAITAARQAPAADGDPVDRLIDAVVQVYREEESARSLRRSADDPALADASRAHKQRMAAGLTELAGALGMTTDVDTGRPVATVAFVAADAVLHEAFAAPEPERAALLAELRLLVRRYLAG
jgi:AcrR family transcriptional regulator